jgi:hypothetical protein
MVGITDVDAAKCVPIESLPVVVSLCSKLRLNTLRRHTSTFRSWLRNLAVDICRALGCASSYPQDDFLIDLVQGFVGFRHSNSA